MLTKEELKNSMQKSGQSAMNDGGAKRQRRECALPKCADCLHTELIIEVCENERNLENDPNR